MPRKKPVGPEQLLEPPSLALPALRTITPHKGHEHERDPYETPPGAVPSRVSNEKVVSSQRLDRKLSASEQQQQLVLKAQQKLERDRYHAYLDALALASGIREKAIAVVFGVTEEEASLNLPDFIAEIHKGRGGSEIAEILERNDLDVAARMSVLRKWTYSDNAAASLNAIKLVNEQDGGGENIGSFESYLRLAKMQGAK